MPLMPIKIPPGIQKETPSLTSEPAWRDCDKVRFKAGQPEKIGGWVLDASGSGAITGVSRSILTWRLNNGLIVTAIGTNQKVYILEQSTLHDITPLRETQALGTDPFSTAIGSTTVTVTDVAHGASSEDYVTFSGAVCATLTDSEVNANHQIMYIDDDTYTFEVTTAATATDANDGGASVTAEYEVSIGPVSAVIQYGYGTGQYGREAYGDERSIAGNSIELRFWSLDHFGELLVLTHESGRIYSWLYAGNFNLRASLISNSPTYSNLLIVTNPDRHLVAFASETTGTQDKMMIRWADQESTTDWTPTAENTAGDHVLSGGSEIVAARRSQNATFIWTDSAMYSMQFIGPPFTFGFTEIGINCGAVSKNCMINKDTILYWMGKDDFFIYDGVVRVLPCTLHRYIFKDINVVQYSKITVGLIKEFDEIIWFYPSSESAENDRYVIFNYEQQIWYHGTMVRTAWIDSELTQYPLGITDDGSIYHHENGTDDNTSAMTAYIESAEFDLDQGDRFYFLRRLIPDMNIIAGSVDYIFKTKRYPHSTEVTDTTSTISASTEKVDLRIRGRSLAVRVESDAIGDEWRMGTARVDLRPDGRR